MMGSVQIFLLAALFANAKRVYVSKFRVENMAILRLHETTDIPTFLKKTRFLREKSTSDYLSTQKLSTDKK